MKNGVLHPPSSWNGLFGGKIVDSYVTVTVDQEQPKKTTIALKSNSPEWKEPLTL